ncbi:TPA: hypothetical protein N0H38_004463 [Pseudomonas aeruginosa]|uniref:hypothetical protein n=1 Tax=Pseudomonas nitroreducens TaxID=46680 RepID=UPI002448B954|nr:hypothetical protein [Pseudomonas nitroreducens]HCK4503006.1 hypothetical protein [Pseudomonas aeruginosa]MDG9854136.1 hypothetical protein [Pseudomonas nitroreducens]HCK4574099.1 hypothetical protein [Pseudomonas aeruginosa]HCK4790542.1 hypothetical protein [Pseudomonas aeruginosa]HCK4799646.1 hypothetical protein [Pseudomonas aeruginosa]
MERYASNAVHTAQQSAEVDGLEAWERDLLRLARQLPGGQRETLLRMLEGMTQLASLLG